ncbi:MAG: AAC(3) family N-acetyltransferase [Arenicellaceae bacterium]|nr:AAC(3) family N-acetyltransferase [Arenicellaceae bacterium]
MSIWKNIGLSTGDSIVCHSALFKLGKIEGGVQSILSTIIDTIGETGNFITPTFTYSFMRNEIYDVDNSPSTVGILGDIVRNSNESVRSLDGNFSWSALGKDRENLMRIDTKESFGKNSFFDKLRGKNGKCLLLGVDFDALPFFMFLEKEQEVPYRYNKKFNGKIKVGDLTRKDYFVHYVRDENLNPISARLKIGDIIKSDSRCKISKIGYGEAICAPLSLIQEFVEKHIQQDAFILID